MRLEIIMVIIAVLIYHFDMGILFNIVKLDSLWSMFFIFEESENRKPNGMIITEFTTLSKLLNYAEFFAD